MLSFSWWPWGTATTDELAFEVSAREQDNARFTGWASELHLFYITIEVALITSLWPGWSLQRPWNFILFAFLTILGLAVGAWDRYHLLIQRHLQEQGSSRAGAR